MTKRVAIALSIAIGASSANAWEAQTTHAGLAEQAALASRLHQRLLALGWSGGLFEPLTIPPADAKALTEGLRLLSPAHGSVPDARGRQTALAWIAAGAALADVPASHGANHFFDVSTQKGWQHPGSGLLGSLAEALRSSRAKLPDNGIPAPDWVTDKRNPLNLAGFLDQYAKAASARTPGERSRAMAGALVAAGALLHALGDLGTPSRVRGDEAAHLESLGGGPDDLGSRFERIAALAYGRLGVPAPGRTVTRSRLRDFFTSKDGGGLADVIARSYFSPNTLPPPSRIGAPIHTALGHALPALPSKLNLIAASREDGTTLRSADGTCLARYRVDRSVVSFSLDDDCVLDQIASILPEVSAYETGMLDFLFRGELTIAHGANVVVTAKDLGAGTVEIFLEDDHGVRTSIATSAVAAGSDKLVEVATPTSGSRIVAVFRGADTAGEPVVAIGVSALAPR